MSGLEVVGVVLGAIPLVISALEHYAEVVSTVRMIRRAAQEFRAVARKLEAEHVIFRNSLMNLLNDCTSIRPETLKTLLHTVGGSAWREPDVEAALLKRLGGSMKSYHEHVQSISIALHTFKERLRLDDSGKVPFSDTFTFKEAWKRFRFSLRVSDYMELIQDIKDDNTTLQRLAEQTFTLHVSRIPGRMPDFQKIRSGAASVFESLQNALHVSCALTHKASIHLGPIADPAQGDYFVDALSLSFRIVLHHDIVNSKQVAPAWSVEEAEIRTIQTGPHAASHTQIRPVASSSVRRKKEKVKVQVPGPIAQGSSPSLFPEEILDLCESLQSMRSTKCGTCLGYLAGKSSSDRHGIFWPNERLTDPASLSVETFVDLLKQSSHPGHWTNADARRLAVPLAAGVLRLHDTPWLNKTWDNRQISIFRRNGKLLADHPFVSIGLTSAPVPPSIIPDTSIAARIIRNHTLFTLGIMLVEMCMGKPMHELHKPNELNTDGMKHGLSDYQTATRLLDMDEVSDRFGQRWSNVARRCIYCDLNQAKTSFEDIGFQQAVYNEVLAELEEERRQFFQLE